MFGTAELKSIAFIERDNSEIAWLFDSYLY